MAKERTKTWFKMAAKGAASADISIFQEIGAWGITAQDFHDQLQGLGKRDELRISISSDGGDVSQGTAIYNILNRNPANKIVTIEGLAASMASVIAMAGDEIIMPANSMMMIHNPWGGVMGEADQVKSFGEALEIMQDNIAQAYVDRTGIDEKTILAMMEKETWLSAERAVSLGFADRVEAARDINARFELGKFNRTPKAFRVHNAGASMTKAAKDAMSESGSSDSSVVKTKGAIRKEVVAANKEIRSLCALAGMPALADEYIEADLSVSQAIAKLDEAKTEAAKGKDGKGKDGKGKGKDGTELNAHNRGGADTRSAATLDPVAIYKNWNGKKK